MEQKLYEKHMYKSIILRASKGLLYWFMIWESTHLKMWCVIIIMCHVCKSCMTSQCDARSLKLTIFMRNETFEYNFSSNKY